MCIQQRTVSSNETQNTKKQNQEIKCLKVSAVELYETCLETLKSKFQGERKELFYQSFENAYRQISYKNRENKRRYWSRTSLLLIVLGTGGSGTVAAVCLFTIARELFSASTESGALTAVIQSCVSPILIFLLALGFLAACLFTEFERRNYKETWARHSAAYHRLNISMVRHLSGLTGEEDFMKEVLHILEVDIDRFEHNISAS